MNAIHPSLALIKAVAGIEINGCRETAVMPRCFEESALATLTSASMPDVEWLGGMGCIESQLINDEDHAEGKYIARSLDPREMYLA
jgi:hypothetical protein